MQLCGSWLRISLDAATGTDQNEDTYWERITEDFNRRIIVQNYQERSLGALKGKWNLIKTAVSAFSGSYNQVAHLNISGISEVDMVSLLIIIKKKDTVIN